MSLSLHGWTGDGVPRLALEVPAGAVVTVRVPDPGALLARVAGLRRPALWVRVRGRDHGRLSAHARAGAGLATLDGRPPLHPDLTVRDLLLLGRPGQGRLGFLGLGGQLQAEEREAAARALAGRLGLGAVLERPLAALDAEHALLADCARVLLAEPAALVAAPEPALADRLLALLEAEAAGTGMAACVLLPLDAGPGHDLGHDLGQDLGHDLGNDLGGPGGADG